MDKWVRKAKKDLKLRFGKAEMAAVGILLFIFIMFPLGIFLAGLAAYLGYRYLHHKVKKNR